MFYHSTEVSTWSVHLNQLTEIEMLVGSNEMKAVDLMVKN